MTFSDKFSSPYLKAIDLPDGRKRVTITDVTAEWMGQPREQKYVAYFAELDKGLVLNKTNGTALQEAFGDEVTASVGKVIDLVVKPGSFQGEDINVVRIEVPREQPWLPPNDADPHRRLDEVTTTKQSGDDDIPF